MAGKDPFGAFVARASRDPVAHAALAGAYASFDRRAREELVDAALAAARAERVPVAPLLAAFLSVEPIGAVAARIAEALYAIDREDELAPETEAFGVIESDRVILVRPLYGAFCQVLALGLDAEGPRSVDVDDLVDRQSIDERVGARRRVPYEAARGKIVDVLWRAHRAGRGIATSAAVAKFL
jgi:hypothetical protein